jgi:hypothetical protein
MADHPDGTGEGLRKMVRLSGQFLPDPPSWSKRVTQDYADYSAQ